MALTEIQNIFGALADSNAEGELLELNEKLRENNLPLTREEAREILKERNRALRNQGRIELDLSVTKELAIKLSESPYIAKDNFVQNVNEMYEIFHFIKNATSDFVSDMEIIDAEIFYFNKIYGGSAELLAGKGVEKIIENFKEKKELRDCENREDEEYWSFDE